MARQIKTVILLCLQGKQLWGHFLCSNQRLFSQSSSFYASISQDGNIVASDMTGRRVVGVSIEKYQQIEKAANDALAKAEDYHARLVAAGLIVVPKTPEQKIEELSAQVEKLTELLLAKGEDNGHSGNGKSNTSGKQPVARKDKHGAADGEPVPAE